MPCGARQELEESPSGVLHAESFLRCHQDTKERGRGCDSAELGHGNDDGPGAAQYEIPYGCYRAALPDLGDSSATFELW